MGLCTSEQKQWQDLIRPRPLSGIVMGYAGHCLELEEGGVGLKNWNTDRPMRKGGFNIGASKGPRGLVSDDNSRDGGAGVEASWACAARAVDALAGQLHGHGEW